MDLPVFGMKNDDSVCYLNSLLQCLFSNTDLVRCILDERDRIPQYQDDDKKHITVSFTLINTIVSHPSFTEEPRRLMKVDPKAFKDVFIRSSELFTLGMQQDADEFLVTALDKLHNDIKIAVDTKQNIDPKMDANLYHYIKSYKDNYSFITKLFHTQICTKTSCQNCGHSSKKYEMCFQIYLEPPGIQCDLYNCLDKMRTPELLLDYKCDNCKQKSTTTRVSTPSVLPCHLTFVLKRFGPRQISSQVECPLTDLDMTEYMDDSDRQAFLRLNHTKYNVFKYDLYGAIFHVGTSFGGHYYAVCKRQGKWHLFNDEHVKILDNITPDHFKRAYMLFYRRT